MNPQDCKTNTRVAMISKTQPCPKGTIKSEVEKHPSHGQVVIVEWDHGNIQKMTLRSLITEKEGLAQDARIKAEEERLETEWEKAQSQVGAKLQEAANAVNEAARLAKATGHELQEMYDATRPLMRAISNAGWNSSSMSC
jgi:hypothetical protein